VALCVIIHVPPGPLALSTTNPHEWGAHLFLYLFSLLPPQRGYHIAHEKIKNIKKIIPY